MNGRNKVTTYWIHRVEAWYLAGQAAAHLAGSSHRLGVVSAFVNPETVADVNAFTLGARTVDPAIRVYVGHVGFWFDDNLNKKYTYTHTKATSPVTDTYFREEYLAALLADQDCKVIAHLTNTQRSVAEIDRLVKAKLIAADTYSMANDKRQGCVDGHVRAGAPWDLQSQPAPLL
jgi:basic membrane lipoprotein Med (substrate-binding protein (PBP1-ABC) superfamily)